MIHDLTVGCSNTVFMIRERSALSCVALCSNKKTPAIFDVRYAMKAAQLHAAHAIQSAKVNGARARI